MRKSRYITLLLAGAATTMLASCDQHDMTKDAAKDEGTVYSDAAACSKDMDATACEQGFEQAKEEHYKQAPKFTTREECETAGYSKCDQGEVRSADGTSHSFFMPMMMGYMMGRMLGGGGYGGYGSGYGYGYGNGAPPPQRPDDQNRTASSGGSAGMAGRPVYGDRNGYLYTGGQQVGRVAPGTTSLGSGTAVRSVARGGFGARGFSGGS